MGIWKHLFTQTADKFEEREELEIEYFFGNPATDDDLSRLEAVLGFELPSDLQNMLREFNGIEIREKYWGPEPRPLYLSTQNMLVDVPDYIKESGNPMPPDEHLSRVAFFAHQNGFAELYAVCVKSFGGFRSGEILCLDHETGEFQRERNSLSQFVGCCDYCHL